jgi:hypothetical protein
MGARKSDQAVDAFSAPKDLLHAAQLEAKRRGLSKSGFYRYCLAKEVGYSDSAALALADTKPAAFAVIEPASRTSDSQPAGEPLKKILGVKYAVKKTRKKP